MIFHPINTDRLSELPQEGPVVDFQGAGKCQFFSFYMLQPWWTLRRPRIRKITFRCHPGRRPIDRFNIFWIYERRELGLSLFSKFIFAAPAEDDAITHWLHAKYWLYPDQGYPRDKWCRVLDKKKIIIEHKKHEKPKYNPPCL